MADANQNIPLTDPIRIATQAMFERYRAKLRAADWSRETNAETDLPNLGFLCSLALDEIDRYPIDKLNRWLGFVIGVLSVRGITVASAETDLCNSTFQAAYAVRGSGSPALSAPVRAASRAMFERYREIIQGREWLDEGADGTSLPLLSIMCSVAINEAEHHPVDELSRWLGFVQGALATKGVISVEEERAFSRPLFHQAYKLLGTVVPPTRNMA